MKNFYGKRFKKVIELNINHFQNPLPKGAEKRFHFSDFTITLNEEEDGVAPTDSRLRKDQRLMEETKWDEANTEKQVCKVEIFWLKSETVWILTICRFR